MTRADLPDVHRAARADRRRRSDDSPGVDQRFYQRRGWVVTQAADGVGAVERLIGGAEPFDLVISDVKMPGVSGIELHAALRDVRPDMLDRLLFCTGEVESPAVSAFHGEDELPRADEAV